MAEQQEREHTPAAGVAATDKWRPTPARELWDSLLLLGLTASSLGVYVGLAVVAAKLVSR